MHFCTRTVKVTLCLSSAELEIDMRSVIQFNAEHIGKSTRQLFAIDAEQPELVFAEVEAIGARLRIHRQINRIVQRSLNHVRQRNALGHARSALRDAVRIAYTEL